MSLRELLERKKHGGRLDASEIQALVAGYVGGRIPDYQMAALLMAVWFRGLDTEETVALTEAMWKSGQVVELDSIPDPKVDKHSTGGVGDKVSLALVGVAMACGLRVPMLSGRALGHTGGTLDKLEAIPGYSTSFDRARFLRLLADPGGTIVGQGDDLVPADRELYALRDVTATVDCVPLIVASILSKKLASGVRAVVMDVKVGSGAFMRSLEEARVLAAGLVQVGSAFGMRVSVLFTRMDEPIGVAVGNALEVIESVELLRGGGPPDLRQLVIELAAAMLEIGGMEGEIESARARAARTLDDGSALERFRRMVEGHGGRLAWDEPECGLALAGTRAVVRAPRRAVLKAVNGTEVGLAVVELGGGRQRKGDRIDPTVGLRWRKRIGDRLDEGDIVAEVLAQEATDLQPIVSRLQGALAWQDTPFEPQPLVLGRYPENGASGG
ncbi:MAG TPA: thymidine phosphorylase [Candidatus Krumholzibacteria bacterium]|nr:thymidine phosphorylase [Candidatus Krumholzibacteria bacterium]